jgi:hypothetical protein
MTYDERQLPVEPTESQKKTIQTRLVVISFVLAAAALFIFLAVFFGWLPEWKPRVGLTTVRVVESGDKSTETFNNFLPARLTKQAIESKEGGTFTELNYAGATYWVLDVSLGYGVSHQQIGIYAPTQDGTFHLSLSAESWAAGNIEATVDGDTGILEIRERANSKLKGQIVVSCNLRTIGTQHSIREQ